MAKEFNELSLAETIGPKIQNWEVKIQSNLVFLIVIFG